MSSQDRIKLSAVFNRSISQGLFRECADRMILNASPGWLYTLDDATRSVVMMCMSGDQNIVERRMLDSPGVQTVYKERLRMGGTYYRGGGVY